VINLRIRTELWGSAALVSTVFTVAYAVMLAATPGRAPLQTVGLAALTAFAVEYARRQKLRWLRAELAGASRSTDYVIYLNGVAAGAVSRHDHVTMRIRSMLDPRNYVAQSFEVARYGARCLILTAVCVPLLLFWWLVVATWLAPETVIANFAPVFAMIRSAHSAAAIAPTLAMLAKTFLTVAATFGMMLNGAMLVLSSRSPIANVFARDVDERLRRMTGVAARGDVLVSRVLAAPVDGRVDGRFAP